MKYHHDKFYKLKDNTLENKIKVLEWAKNRSYDWHVDDLPSWQRRRIYMGWDEIISHFDEKSHFVIIHRRGYENWKDSDFDMGWKIEIGFRTFGGMENKDLFLFIYIHEEHLEDLFKEFELEDLW